MKFILILFVILSVLRIDLIQANPDKFDLYWDIKVRFCGPLLAVEMAMVCNGRYNEDQRSRRPSKREIVDECCTTPCSRRYLKTYYCSPESEMSNTTHHVEEMSYVNYHSYYMDLIMLVMQSPLVDE